MSRPVLVVLAGLNGAGKSSVLSAALTQNQLTWFNPDDFARARRAQGIDPRTANGEAWAQSLRFLQQAIDDKLDHAFETTLRGKSMTAAILKACETHDVTLLFCGLATVEQHLARVRARVAAGGHDIDAQDIITGHPKVILNLARLLPVVHCAQLYDNSIDAGPDRQAPTPVLIAETANGALTFPAPTDAQALARIPHWARPALAALITAAAPQGGIPP